MRLTNTEYGIEIYLTTDRTSVLCVEKGNIFAKLVSELWNQCDNKEGGWILSEQDETLNLSKKIICIVNPINLDLNDKKLLKVLYQDISADVMDNVYSEFGDINSRVVSFLDEIVQRQPYALEFDDEVVLSDYLKLYNVCFEDESENLLEHIVIYLKLWHRVAGIDVFVFVNLKSYLSEDELVKLYEMVRYEQIYCVLFESHFLEKVEGEDVIIIDKDLCVIDC